MNYKKIFALFLVAAIFINITALAAFDAGRNTVAQITVHPIAPGLDYTSTIEVCEGIRQEIKYFTYKPDSSTKIIPAYGQYIYGFNSVGELISDYDGDGRLVGGINTDFFITSTGVPLSCFISEGEIISSCDNRPALGFDVFGNAIIGYPGISASLKNDYIELEIAHINKTPAVWGLYLVTDTFAKTTKSSIESIEIVFRSYDKELSDKAIEEYLSSLTGNVTDELVEINEDDNQNCEYEIEEAFEADIEEIEESKLVPTGTGSKALADTASVLTADSKRDITVSSEVPDSNEKNIDAYNDPVSKSSDEAVVSEKAESVPENDLSAKSSNDEEKLNSDDFDNNSRFEIPLELFVLTEEAVKINSSVEVVVTEIRDGVKNGDIPENSFVLCIPKEQFGYMVKDISVGDCFSLNTDCNEVFYEAENIFGAGSILLENGEFVKQPNDSIYLYRNPRTAAGIKSDGTVIFVCVDGRNPGISNGFTAAELADYMLSLGCVDAVNFDGGGSTTFYAADIGEAKASVKNTPSERVERRVANGMLFVNLSEPTERRTYATLMPKHFLTFNKNVVTDISGEVSFADSNGFPMELLSFESVNLAVDERFGFTHNGYFVPNGRCGRAEIFAHIPESEETYYVGFVEITDSVDSLNFKIDDNILSPFEGSSGLSVAPFLNTLPVNFTYQSIEWKIESESEVDDELLYSEVDESEAYLYINESTIRFVPVARNSKYRITASMGDYSESVEIFAEAHPFSDMEYHWASEMSYNMFKNGLILGELSDDGTRSFMPSRYMTRAEFCAVLARILKLDISAYSHLEDIGEGEEAEDKYESQVNAEIDYAENEVPKLSETVETSVDFDETASESGTAVDAEAKELTFEEINEAEEDSNVMNGDIPEGLESADDNCKTKKNKKTLALSDVPEWARGYVYVLYTEGYIDSLIVEKENGELSINADAFITRGDVIRVLGSLLEGDGDAEALEKFPDFVPTSDEDALYFSRIIESGIIGGYEDGTVRADGSLTRAEAATVFSRFIAKFE